MSEAANPQGREEAKLFSKMDLAKRGAEVVAHSLGPLDTLTIISFDSAVSKVLPRTCMGPEGLPRALAALAALSPGGGTELWDGLYAGLYEEVGGAVRWRLGGG